MSVTVLRHDHSFSFLLSVGFRLSSFSSSHSCSFFVLAPGWGLVGVLIDRSSVTYVFLGGCTLCLRIL